MTTIRDIHTHDGTLHSDAIISVAPALFHPTPGLYYSVGIHPWDSNDVDDNTLQLLTQIVHHNQVVAIGETGIDRLRGAYVEQQKKLLILHITLSEQVKKPLILHVVRGIDTILSLYNQYRPQQRWIVHGYRGNETTARQLLDKGIELSYGEKFNPQAIIATPLEKLWIESDNSNCSIDLIYNHIAHIKNIDTESLEKSIAERAAKLFFTTQ